MCVDGKEFWGSPLRLLQRYSNLALKGSKPKPDGPFDSGRPAVDMAPEAL